MKPLYCLLLAMTPVLAQVKVTQNPGRISVDIDGKPFTELFVSGPEVTKPYLHPLRAASGKIVTRAYPMAKVEGESTDHPHHRGLWFSHDEVNGFHFWLNELSEKNEKNGTIVLKKVGALKSGKDQGSIAVTFDWNDPQGQDAAHRVAQHGLLFRSQAAHRRSRHQSARARSEGDLRRHQRRHVCDPAGLGPGGADQDVAAVSEAHRADGERRKAPRARRKSGASAPTGSITGANSKARSSASRSSTIPAIRSTRPTGMPAATACSPPIPSASAIFTTTRRATAASPSSPARRFVSAIAS